MTKFYVEDTVIEKLREQDLNIDVLLQKYAKKQKTEIVRRVVEDEEFIMTYFDDKIEIVRK